MLIVEMKQRLEAINAILRDIMLVHLYSRVYNRQYTLVFSRQLVDVTVRARVLPKFPYTNARHRTGGGARLVGPFRIKALPQSVLAGNETSWTGAKKGPKIYIRVVVE